MKREGRQHGMVKTHPIMSAPLKQHPRRREPNGLNPTPTADLFTKVPTNPSKFNGKCGQSQTMCRECHLSPASNSKDKAKGPQRLRSSFDVVSDYKLITWRLVDATPGLKLSGFSATGVLDYLDRYHYYGADEEEQNNEIGEVVECKAKNNEINSQNDDVCVSFCDNVGFAWQLEGGDEDWYLV